jgi:predicted nuclease with TOPRIM domain
VDTLRRIVAVLGGSLDDLFAESKIIVGDQNLAALQEEVGRLNAENDRLNSDLSILAAENTILKDKISTLTAESDLLRLKLEHKEEIIALHNYYKALISGLPKS